MLAADIDNPELTPLLAGLAPGRAAVEGEACSGDGEPDTAEHRRLAEATGRAEDDLFNANPWYEWGLYLSGTRAWCTVREDYSDNGDAWRSFPHDHARSRSYRWNEDGMAGLSDIRHELCLGLSLWNGVDPILKERMFGLTGPEGNHGEDVKACWRGPVWPPTNYLVIQALVQYDRFFGPERLVEYPTGSCQELSLGAVAADLADRLVSIWLPDGDGRRPVSGGYDVLDLDPTWSDHLQFFEYFHVDLGIGLGASHQTGWTALVGDLTDIDPPGVRPGEHP